jgi:hypothetical protein
MSSVSVSESVSDVCCIPSDCACDDWLTIFCDYQTVSLEYCGETTVFQKARSTGIKMSAVNPQSGVHPADRVFKLSYRENEVEIGIGGVITDEDGTEWVIYAMSKQPAFCVEKIWARSVAACFTLLEVIDVFEPDCSCETEDCGTKIRYRRVARVKGKITASTGSLLDRNDSRELVYRFQGDLVRWPLAGRPTAGHRLRDRNGTYRIVGVEDRGMFVPYTVRLEAESADCSVS